MATQEKLYTADDLLALPDDNKRYELVKGELVEVSPSGDVATELAMWIGHLLLTHVIPRNLGAVTGADGGFLFKKDPDTVRAPDVGFIASAKLTPQTGKYYTSPPDLAVEVVSPNDRQGEINDKVAFYFKHGVRLAWVVYPELRVISVRRPGTTPITLSEADTLDGGEVLPDFAVKVSEIFAQLRPPKQD